MCSHILMIRFVYIAIVVADIGITKSVEQPIVVVDIGITESDGQQSKCENLKALREMEAALECLEETKCDLAWSLHPSYGYPITCGDGKICCPKRTPTQIALDKCSEYGQSPFEKLMRPSSLKEILFSPTFIRGGVPVTPNEFPHMALLGHDNNSRIVWDCGGSIISEQYILTAAHCSGADIPGWEVKWALIHSTHRPVNSRPQYGIILRIIDRFNHPEYKQNNRNVVKHDIALLKIDGVKETLQPLCIFEPQFVPAKIGLEVQVAGWGTTSAGSEVSDRLLKASVEILDERICLEFYKYVPSLVGGFDPKTMICAGNLNQTMDSCKGDSGGPLQIQMKGQYHQRDMYLLLGIVSGGPINCGENYPAIYSNVSYYLPWIQGIVWPEEYHHFPIGQNHWSNASNFFGATFCFIELFFC